MKVIKELLCLVLVTMAVALSIITSFNSKDRVSRFLDNNVEALSEKETITMQCAQRSVLIECKIKCLHCGKEWTPISWVDGPYVLGSARCICGYTL